MFAYIEKDSFLHRRNPLIKLILIVAVTIIVCLSYFPVLPFLTFLIFFAGDLDRREDPIPQSAAAIAFISGGELSVHGVHGGAAGAE